MGAVPLTKWPYNTVLLSGFVCRGLAAVVHASERAPASCHHLALWLWLSFGLCGWNLEFR
jgi:hypothetical protein